MFDDGGDVVVFRTYVFVVFDGRFVVYYESYVLYEECGEGDCECVCYY